MHERVHSQEAESHGDIRTVRGLRLRSLRLGLTGIADVVEFHKQRLSDSGDGENVGNAKLIDFEGRWAVVPVEYKRGKPKSDHSDEVQICAQALCLEEMLTCLIGVGFIFYGKTKHRIQVDFDRYLREKTESLDRELHAFIESRNTPPAVYESKCDACSIVSLCMPESAGSGKRVDRYIRGVLEQD